ncbi:M14 family metallopeptidase [Litchfieldia salsa]|uniref:G-D-glutamyl-meso-diaminopimelate peptidase n=1 Tax=Litchfieldia salsa TaxID=930152 RepID=A0A1H0VCK7_9BACI|nr:M14 family metallopeptidase [Litchfieldia salsa]SDP76074.1 g-D-glutamyl-meso-diaminopimelate peptidase [Litchfieldia salsa]
MKVIVRLGDSLWYYSQIFGVPLQLMIDSNRKVNAQELEIGSKINIPGFIIKNYNIKQGDTLWKLARKRNLLPDALFILNQGIDPENLQVGQEIYLPSRVTMPIINAKQNYDYQTLISDLKQLQEIYPFLRETSIGNSVLGAKIPEIRIGRGKKKVHLNGSFHANEWITTAVIMKFMNEYLLSLTNMGSIRGFYMDPFYYECTLSIVPMLNPDGVDLVLNGPPNEEPYRSSVVEINKGSLDFKDWKANIRGIDLNNQFPANWEIEKERKEPKSPAPRDYPGDAPLTEPEAIAITQLTKKRDFNRVLAFHTQGKEIYWGYEGAEPREAEPIVREFARVSGYRAVRYIDSHAGYKDWFIQEYKRPGYTIELGEGVNPLPLSQFDEIYQQSLGIFLASMYM